MPPQNAGVGSLPETICIFAFHYSFILTLYQSNVIHNVDAMHYPGEDNNVTDALSHPEIATMLDIAIMKCLDFRLPSPLICHILKLQVHFQFALWGTVLSKNIQTIESSYLYCYIMCLVHPVNMDTHIIFHGED
jgi:hypothetical protein